MSIKRINNVFCAIITIIIIVPALFFDFEGGRTSDTENRILAKRPNLILQDGSWNTSFINQVKLWIDDNIGFREQMVAWNNKIMYHVFHTFDNDLFYMLGPQNELNYTSTGILEDWHHLNLLSEDEINIIVENYQYVNDYIKSKGIQYYLVQCWDKQSIYPEYFPQHSYQYGEKSRTDQVMGAIAAHTDIHLINLKQSLLEAKKKNRVFPVWGDPSHWNQRGAFIGYVETMKAINKENNNIFYILNEEDFEIKEKDLGITIVGNIHEEDMEETFELKRRGAVRNDSKLTHYCDTDSRYWSNENVDNNKKLLILGDSYYRDYLTGYFAESFKEVIFLYTRNTENLIDILDIYKPDILLNQNAERMFPFDSMNSVVQQIKSH